MKKLIIFILVLVPVVAILTGCMHDKKTEPEIGKKVGEACEIDRDCGPSSCDYQNQEAIKISCQEGKCAKEVEECKENKACLLDSKGARCETPPLEKDKLPCTTNTSQMRVTGQNIYNTTFYECSDDCPLGFKCGADTCLCEEDTISCEEPLFAFNWEQDTISAIQALFDVYNYADLEGKSEEELKALGSYVAIPAFKYYVERDVKAKSYIIPFPEDQFELLPASPKHVPCANEYYSAGQARDMYSQMISRPKIDCGWGGPTSFQGLLVICIEELTEWLDNHRNVF